jgi:hypothetical protein
MSQPEKLNAISPQMTEVLWTAARTRAAPPEHRDLVSKFRNRAR